MKNINHSLNNKIESESKNFKNIFEGAQTVGLSADEKSGILLNLKKKMAGEGLVSPYYTRPYTLLKFISSPIFEWRLRKKTALLFVAMLLIAYGTMTSFAAEKAVPGDVLYPIKIYVNKWVKTVVAQIFLEK